jgi:hypothetical protein
MYSRGRFALFGLVVLFVAALTSAADEPEPLLKPITPPKGQLRVRLPVTPGLFPKVMQFSAQVPRGKKQQQGKTEPFNILVALHSLPNPSFVAVKKLESWGYEVPKGAKEFVLPELLIPAAQIAPKPDQQTGADVLVRLTNLKLTVVTSPASTDDSVFQSDMTLSATGLFQGAERTIEPRLSFGDKFLELTVPAQGVKRSGTDALMVPEPTVNPDAKLVPAYSPMVMRGGAPAFAFASINGQDSYKTPDGKVIPVLVKVESGINEPSGVLVTMGLGRGCKIDIDQAAAGEVTFGADIKSQFIPAKIKELRLAVNTGPGMKTVKDLVIKDLTVAVDKNQSEGYMLIGQKFIDDYYADGVYAHSGDGWKLHGRIHPDLLFDIKTRKPDPKKPDPKKPDPKKPDPKP